MRSAAIAVAAVIMLGIAAGCAVDTPQALQGTAGSGADPIAGSLEARLIVLRFGDEAVPATLTDGAAAREISAMLPLTVDLRDPMGQAKSGRLPGRLDSISAELVTDPAAGGICYAPSSGTIAIFYVDLGQSVPDGMVQLGTADSDLPAVAAAGHRIRLRIYPTEYASN